MGNWGPIKSIIYQRPNLYQFLQDIKDKQTKLLTIYNYLPMKVIIYFPGDYSVGISSYSYEMTIPTFEPEYREETRELIRTLYAELDGEFAPEVFFEDEKL